MMTYRGDGDFGDRRASRGSILEEGDSIRSDPDSISSVPSFSVAGGGGARARGSCDPIERDDATETLATRRRSTCVDASVAVRCGVTRAWGAVHDFEEEKNELPKADERRMWTRHSARAVISHQVWFSLFLSPSPAPPPTHLGGAASTTV
jgi:acetyl esterase/lipase